MRITIISAIFMASLYFTTSLQSQVRSFGTLPIVNNGNLVVNSNDDLSDTDEHKHIERIYNELVTARGDYRYRVPSLYLKDVEGYVAYIDYNTFDIVFEKKAYEVCKKYGDRAIAFLLGHELSHFYEKHAWKNAFTTGNKSLEISRELGSMNDQLLNETEADYLGGFLSYTAGYGVFDQVDELIDDLYNAYNLNDEIDGYPSKQDRIEISNNTTNKVKLLKDVFDTANYLSAIGRYGDALDYYSYILNFYQSREIFNNVGYAAVMSALELFDSEDLKYKYVTAMDLDYRGSKGNGKDLKTELLQQAIMHFNTAINLDPNYVQAYINKANAFALLKDFKKAEFFLTEEALPLAMKDEEDNTKSIADIYVLMGIIRAEQEKDVEAEEYFQKAVDMGVALAEHNLSILKNGSIPTQLEAIRITDDEVFMDPVGDMTLEKFYEYLQVDDKKIVKIKESFTLFQQTPSDKKSKVLLSLEDSEKKYTAFLKVSDGYTGSTNKGIKIGDEISKVRTEYGPPENIVQTSQGELYVYEHILFIINDSQVQKWINYDTRKFNF